MSSRFTWLHSSEADRRGAMEVIDLFCERDTRDELGLGVVRDAFSDLLFPGTTTIQTAVHRSHLLLVIHLHHVTRITCLHSLLANPSLTLSPQQSSHSTWLFETFDNHKNPPVDENQRYTGINGDLDANRNASKWS